MTERQRNEASVTDHPEPARRPWSPPTLEIISVADDTEGPANGFPNTDSITGVS